MIEKTKTKAKRRVLSVFLGMLVLMALLALSSVTSFAATSGDYNYTVLSDGTAEITGCNGYIAEELPSPIPAKIDGYTVTSIGDYAFSNWRPLKEVTIPNTVTHIGNYAFHFCISLANINLPSNLKTIGDNAFDYCSALEDIILPNTLTSIGSYAFCNSGLKSLKLPNNITSIGGYAFSLCSDLTDVNLPTKLTKIEDSLFWLSPIKAVTIPSGVTSIEDSAFRGTELSTITIPNSVKSIGSLAFCGCNFKTVNIPSSVTSIGDEAFCENRNLTGFTVDSNNKYYSAVDGVLFNKDKTVLIAYPIANTRTSYTIPKSVKSFGIEAFKEIANLKTVTITGNVKKIDDSLFLQCKSLTTVNIEQGVTSIGKQAFENCSSLMNITIPDSVTSIGGLAFRYCTSLRKINIPSGVNSIESGTFAECWNLQNIKIPSGVTTIKQSAFSSCLSLSSIIIPKSVTSILSSAFKDCMELKYVYYTGNSSQWKSINIEDYYNNYLTNANIHFNYIVKVATPNISSVANTAIGVKVTWDKVDGAEKYRVFYKANGESTWHKAGDATGTNYTWTKAKSGTKYTFTVRCVTSDGSAYASSYDKTGKTLTYIAAPKLSSVSNATTGVKIAWGKVTGAAKYRVFYKTGNSGWTKIADTTSTSYTWTGAKSGTKYTFTVRCVDKDGKNFTSAYDTTGKSITYIAAPKLSSVANAATGVTIKWAKSAGAAKYRVFYKTGNSGWKKIADTTSTSYTWKGAKSGTKYTFTVRCVDKDGKNFTSAYNTTGKSITYIAAPKLSAVANTATGVKIAWGKVTGAAKYRVFYKANGESTWHKAGDTTGTSFTWTKAKSGTKYTFTVRCIDKNGNYTSSYDSKGKSITYVAAPKISSLTKSSSAVTVKWGKVTGAAKYRVFYKANGESTWHKLGDTTSTGFTWKGAKKGTKYTFTVRCVDKDGKTYTSSYDNTGKSITR